MVVKGFLSKKGGFRRSWVLAALFLGAVGGCGGGEDSPPANTLSGTAATGAAVVGGEVLVKGSKKLTTPDVTTDEDGNFTVTLEDKDGVSLTPPYVLKVTPVGGEDPLYSAATQKGGRVNVTQITSVILANATGGKPDAAFDKPPTAETLTEKALSEAETRLEMLMEIDGQGLDLRKGVFKAGDASDPIDSLLDKVKTTLHEGNEKNSPSC